MYLANKCTWSIVCADVCANVRALAAPEHAHYEPYRCNWKHHIVHGSLHLCQFSNFFANPYQILTKLGMWVIPRSYNSR